MMGLNWAWLGGTGPRKSCGDDLSKSLRDNGIPDKDLGKCAVNYMLGTLA